MFVRKMHEEQTKRGGRNTMVGVMIKVALKVY